jgi:hypothetical protein
MKILLFGELSGLHKNLQVGLLAAGHQVDLVSSGDGFKAIFGDVSPPKLRSTSAIDKLRLRLEYFQFVRKISGYDIVQMVNVDMLFQDWFPYKRALQHLRDNNNKVFLLAAGSDAFYWQKARHKLRYGPFDDVLRFDKKSKKIKHQSKRSLLFNKYIAESVNGIIPIAYEYRLAYQSCENLRATIPLPIDLHSIKFKPNNLNGRIALFHGLNRYGFKGTRHVEQAFKQLNTSYGEIFSCDISGRLPLTQYLNRLQAANIVIDQLNSYSYGMNALYAAAMGKIVLSGAEPECLKEFGVDTCPIINVLPEANDLVKKILALHDDHRNIASISSASREYVEKIHCCHKVASAYIMEWKRN